MRLCAIKFGRSQVVLRLEAAPGVEIAFVIEGGGITPATYLFEFDVLGICIALNLLRPGDVLGVAKAELAFLIQSGREDFARLGQEASVIQSALYLRYRLNIVPQPYDNGPEFLVGDEPDAKLAFGISTTGVRIAMVG